MADYIKREDALSLKKPFPKQKGMITLYQQYFIDPDAVKQLPAADVRPIIYARYNSNGVCTKCGYEMPTDTIHDTLFGDEVLFCYHCGAIMDGGGIAWND